MIFKKKLSTRDMVKTNSRPTHESNPESDKPQREKKQSTLKKNKKTKQEKSVNSQLNRSKALIGIFSIVIGLAISLIGIPLLRAETTNLVPVYIFTQSARRGTQITDDMIEEIERSSYHLPLDLVMNKTELVGGFLTADIIKGDIATMGRISLAYPGDNPELADLPAGKLAVSITLESMSQSVSSMLRAGDIIQIFAVGKDSDDEVQATLSPPTLQYVEVLDVSDNAGLDVSVANVNLVNTITVLVNTAQAEELVILEHTATLHAALAIRGDDTAKEIALETQDAWWALDSVDNMEVTD